MNIHRRTLAALGMACATCVPAAQALTREEQTEMVAAHNKWRQEAGVAGVTWSANLAVHAQRWADHLRQNQCRMTHSGTRDTGENLYWASPLRSSSGVTKLQEVTPRRVADAWGSEKQHYHYADNSCTPGNMCGHYTQLVWKSTTEIGCARAVCDDQSQVWVCQYTPPGNMRGQKPF